MFFLLLSEYLLLISAVKSDIRVLFTWNIVYDSYLPYIPTCSCLWEEVHFFLNLDFSVIFFYKLKDSFYHFAKMLSDDFYCMPELNMLDTFL